MPAAGPNGGDPGKPRAAKRVDKQQRRRKPRPQHVGAVPGVGAATHHRPPNPPRRAPRAKPHGVGAVPGVGPAVKRRVHGLNKQSRRYGLKPINARKVVSGNRAEQRRVARVQRGVNIRRDRARSDRAARVAARTAGPAVPASLAKKLGRPVPPAPSQQEKGQIHQAEMTLHARHASQAGKAAADRYLQSQGIIVKPVKPVAHAKADVNGPFDDVTKHVTGAILGGIPGAITGNPAVTEEAAVKAVRPVIERLSPTKIDQLTSPTAGGVEPVKSLIKGAVGAASGDFLQSKGQKKLQQAGIAPTALPRADTSKVISRTVEKGVLAAGGAIEEGFDRTAGAGVSLASKTAVETGLIHDPKLVRKIKAARGPDQVILHGRDKKNPLTGGDLTQGLGLGRTEGIIAELALDPTTYVGVSALPETGGASGGLIAAKLAKLGIGAKRAEEAGKALSGGERTAKTLDEVRTARTAFDDTHGRLFKKFNKRTAGGKGRSSSHFVPGPEGQAAVRHAHQHLTETRTRPGFQIHVGNPARPQFGKAHINVPLGPLAKLPVVPTTSRARRAAAELAFARSRGSERLKREHQIGEINDQIAAAQREGDHRAVQELTSARQSVLKSSLVSSAKLRAEGSKAARGSRWQSLEDVVSAHNAKRVTTEAGKVGDEFGRLVNEKFMANVQKAIKPLSYGKLPGRAAREKDSLVRIGQYMRARADTAGAVVPHELTPREHFVVGQLDRVYKAMEQQAAASGVMSKGLSDYGGPLHWRFETTEGGKAPDAVSIVNGMAGSIRTTAPRFVKHRLYPSAAEIADPHALAESIQNVSVPPRSHEEALQIANDWHAHGNIRMRQEMIARQLQRGHIVKYEHLSPEDYKAVQYGVTRDTRGAKETAQPLFELDHEHQMVKLTPAGEQHFGFDPGEFGGLDEMSGRVQRLYSAQKDRQHLDEIAVRQAHDPNAHIEFAPRAKSLDAEIANLDVPLHELPAETQQSVRGTLGITAAERPVTQEKMAAQVFQPGEYLRHEGLNAKVLSREPNGPRVKLNVVHDDGSKATLDVGNRKLFAQLGTDGFPAELKTSVFLNDHGLVMIGEGKNPLPGVLSDTRPRRTPDEAAVDEDPFDWAGRLPDIRRLESGTLPEFDPRIANFYRSRAQGYTAAEHAWYRAVDQEHGRSTSDAEQQFTTPDGTTHPVSELAVEKNDEGDIVGYEHVPEGHAYSPDELQFQEPSLIATGRGSEYLDPTTNQAYRAPVLAHTNDLAPGVDETRVWPLQTIDDVNLRNAGSKLAGSQGAYERLYQSALSSGWQRMMGYLRFGVTTPFPAYHIRNLISDSIKSLQADTGVLFHPVANAKLAMAAYGKGLNRAIRVPGYGKIPIEDFLLLADTYPVRSGHHIAEVYRLIDNGKFTESEAKRFLGTLGPGGVMTKLGGEREDIVRFQTFMQAMRRTKGDAAESMFYTIRHHFNYNDLSAKEKRFARNAFLFYTWYRKNIPLQLVELVRRPGFFAGIVHTYDALEHGETPIQQDFSGAHIGPVQLPDLSGPVPPQPALPEYVVNKLLSAPISWNGHAINIGFGLPQADLQLISTSGAGDVLQLANPAISIGYSLISRKDVLTGRQYKDQESSGIAEVLDTVLKKTGIDPGGLPKPDGKTPMLPWWANVALRSLPILGRGAGTLGPASEARDSGANFDLARQLQPITGLNIYPSPAPGSAHEKRAITSLVAGRVAQYNEDKRNLPKHLTKANEKKWVLEQRDELRSWAREQGIPLGYLRRAKASPFHPNKGRTRKANAGLPKGGSTTSLPSLSGGGGLP